MALCSVERTQLCKFGRGNPEEQFCEIVLNLDLWYGGDFVQKISYLELRQPFCLVEQNHWCNLVEDIIRNNSVQLY